MHVRIKISKGRFSVALHATYYDAGTKVPTERGNIISKTAPSTRTITDSISESGGIISADATFRIEQTVVGYLSGTP